MAKVKPYEYKSLREFTPDNTDLWYVKFPQAPAPFNERIPAVDVTMNLWSLELVEHGYGNTTVKYPVGTSAFPFSITYVEDEEMIQSTWFADWVNNDILGTVGCVRPLDLCHRRVELVKFNRQLEKVASWKLLIVPDGSHDFTGNAAMTDIKQSVHQFVIVGTY